MPTDKGELGKRIAFARELAGLQQAALARLLDLTPQTMWRYETGRSMPSLDTLARIAVLCGVSRDWLIFGEGEPRVAA